MPIHLGLANWTDHGTREFHGSVQRANSFRDLDTQARGRVREMVSTMRVRMLAWGALLGLLAAVLTPMAASAQAQTTTTHFNVTGSRPDVNPCTGAPGTVTETIKGVAHLTELPNGAHHATTTGVETFTFVPDDPSQPTYSGKGTFWSGDNVNSKTFTLTFTAHINALGTDGSRLRAHFVGHVTITPDGTVTVEFERDRLSCP
jgi:hypothetical protein